LTSDATDAEIRAAYLRLARRAHPDAGAADGGASMAAVNEAYRVLSRPEARRAYDARLRAGTDRQPTTDDVWTGDNDADVMPPSPGAATMGRVLTPSGPARMPWKIMAVCAVIGGGVVLVSSFFTDPPSEEEPDGILRVGSCVAVEPNNDVREIACEVDDSLVVDLVLPTDAECPFPLLRYRDRLTSSTACVDDGG
jgi:molecular chaperone DnaJ